MSPNRNRLLGNAKSTFCETAETRSGLPRRSLIVTFIWITCVKNVAGRTESSVRRVPQWYRELYAKNTFLCVRANAGRCAVAQTYWPNTTAFYLLFRIFPAQLFVRNTLRVRACARVHHTTGARPATGTSVRAGEETATTGPRDELPWKPRRACWCKTNNPTSARAMATDSAAAPLVPPACSPPGRTLINHACTGISGLLVEITRSRVPRTTRDDRSRPALFLRNMTKIKKTRVKRFT